MQREKLGSRLGFILLSAGCAIGIGNVWKFPYMAGQYGGGVFVLIYLFFLAVFGIPVMTMEFAIGRASQKSPVLMHKQLESKGSKWHIHGYFCLAGLYLLMMFYTTVSGWMLNYFVATATGKFEGADPEQVSGIFNGMLASPVSTVVFMGIIVLVGFVVCSFSLQKGLERITKFMMLALLAIMLVLAFNSIFMDGGKEGLSFYLLPDIDKIKTIGIGNVIVGAMSQAFFTLSLGMGAMSIFGSYIDKDRSLLGESVNIAVIDTFVAVTSGLIIFPACFAYGVEVNSGPKLIFVTLPNIFNNMTMGKLWGSLFFIFMTFAALSTVFAAFEAIVACCTDLFNCSRKKACTLNAVPMFLLSLPCALGFNILSDFKPLGEGTSIMELEDFIVSNIILPLGSLAFILFCTSRYGWGWDNFVQEANHGKGLKVASWMQGYMSYLLPVLVLTLFVVGIINKFS